MRAAAVSPCVVALLLVSFDKIPVSFDTDDICIHHLLMTYMSLLTHRHAWYLVSKEDDGTKMEDGAKKLETRRNHA